MLDANLLRLRQCVKDIQFTLVSQDPGYSRELYGADAVEPIGFLAEGSASDRANLARLQLAIEAARCKADGSKTTEEDLAINRIVDAIYASDGVLISGGGNLSSTWPQHIFERVAVIQIARILGKRIAVSGQTIGPNLSVAHLELIRDTLPSVDFLGARELDTFERSLQLGLPVGRLEYHVDDAMHLPGEPYEPAANLSQPFVAVTLHAFSSESDEDRALHSLAQQLERIADYTNLRLVFLPHLRRLHGSKRFSDLRIGRKLADFMEEPDRMTVMDVGTGRRVAWLTRQASMVISSRYHPLVFGLGGAVPSLGLFTDEYTRVKLQGALEHADLQRWSMSMSSALSGALFETAKEMWDSHAEIRGGLAAYIEMWAALDDQYVQKMVEALGLTFAGADRYGQDSALTPEYRTCILAAGTWRSAADRPSTEVNRI